MAKRPETITDLRVIGTINPGGAGDTVAPTVPQSVVATAQGAGSVQITWSASFDAVGVTGYQVWRNGSPLNTTASASYTDGTTQPSTLYSYTVSAFDAAGNSSAQSSQSQVTTPANATPSWQAIPSQTLIVGNSYTLNLALYASDADQDTLTYSIPTGTLPSGLIRTGSLISGTPTTAGETPTITVRAADQFTTVDTTIAFASYNADVTAPPVPTGLAASAVSSSQINVSWNASTDVIGAANEYVSGTQDYRLYRSTDGTNFSLRTTVTGTSYSDTGLSGSTQYFYKLTARDVSLNESAQSSAQTATTQASGSFVHGDPVTIPGSGFGSTMPTFAFLGGANGIIETTANGVVPPDSPGWVFRDPDFSSYATVGSDATRGKCFTRFQTGNSAQGQEDFEEILFADFSADRIPAGGKLYLSYYLWTQYTNGSSGAQNKIIRVEKTQTVVDSNTCFTCHILDNSMGFPENPGGGDPLSDKFYHDSGSELLNTAAWQRVELKLQAGTQGSSNGRMEFRVFNGSSVPAITAATAAVTPRQLTQMFSYPDANRFGFICFQHGIFNTAINNTLKHDDHYIGRHSFKRVELWNSLTPSLATKREVQKATVWTNTAVTVGSFNKGGFPAGPGFLVVLDDQFTDTVLGSLAGTVA